MERGQATGARVGARRFEAGLARRQDPASPRGRRCGPGRLMRAKSPWMQFSQGGDGWDEMQLAAMLRSGWRRAQGTMARALAESGLSGLEYHVLLAISAVGEMGIRQVDLAQELSVPEGKISVLARHLGERKLIEALR